MFDKLLNIGFRCKFIKLASRKFSSIRSFNKPTSLALCNVNVLPLSQQISIHKSQFLNPVSLLINQIAGFKVKGRLTRRCKDCFFVMRECRLHVLCKTHPRHKQMAMKAKDKKSWILTHATQSHIRPY